MNNKYIVLRHGRNIHQTFLKDYCYGWPDDNPPCKLDEEGLKQVAIAGQKLIDKNIDLIFSSDTLRTKQTSEIVSSILGKEINGFDERLRDLNWGEFCCGPKDKARAFYENKDIMIDRPKDGENWGDIQKRASEFILELEDIYKQKTILIVSHTDTILLLEAWFKDWDLEKILYERENNMIDVGEFREIN
jgi:broad specificity phosphatase PhoE